jgi:hypothetical protein
MYFDTSLKRFEETVPEYPVRPLSHNLEFFFPTERFFGETQEMDGRDGTREDTQDTTRLVEIEEVKHDIRALLFVTKLSPVDAHKDKVAGWESPSNALLALTAVERGKRHQFNSRMTAKRISHVCNNC